MPTLDNTNGLTQVNQRHKPCIQYRALCVLKDMPTLDSTNGLTQVNQRHKPCIQYRACVVDLLGLGIIITVSCVQTISILSASFLFQPYITLNEVFHLLVSSLFVLSNVIVEDTVGLCTCAYKTAMVYYCFFCCGMYEEHCLPTTCDNVVSYIRLYPCAEHGVCQCSLSSVT